MSNRDRIRPEQALREAEGYLDLVTVFADRWPPSPPVRDPLAQRALDALHRLDRHTEHRFEVLYLTGQALRTMERYAEAITPLVEASRENPEIVHVQLALGWCFKRTGRLDLAIEALEQALSIEPSETIVYYNLACYWSLAGNARVALDRLAEALRIDPRFRDLIADEKDFDPIRRDPEFQMLTSVIV